MSDCFCVKPVCSPWKPLHTSIRNGSVEQLSFDLLAKPFWKSHVRSGRPRRCLHEESTDRAPRSAGIQTTRRTWERHGQGEEPTFSSQIWVRHSRIWAQLLNHSKNSPCLLQGSFNGSCIPRNSTSLLRQMGLQGLNRRELEDVYPIKALS